MLKSYPTIGPVPGSQKQHNDVVTSAIPPPAVAHSSMAGETPDQIYLSLMGPCNPTAWRAITKIKELEPQINPTCSVSTACSASHTANCILILYNIYMCAKTDNCSLQTQIDKVFDIVLSTHCQRHNFHHLCQLKVYVQGRILHFTHNKLNSKSI